MDFSILLPSPNPESCRLRSTSVGFRWYFWGLSLKVTLVRFQYIGVGFSGVANVILFWGVRRGKVLVRSCSGGQGRDL